MQCDSGDHQSLKAVWGNTYKAMAIDASLVTLAILEVESDTNSQREVPNSSRIIYDHIYHYIILYKNHDKPMFISMLVSTTVHFLYPTRSKHIKDSPGV